MKHKERYYNQRQIAEILGISKATASRYLNKIDVSAKEENGAKLYPETILKQLKEQLKSNQTISSSKKSPSTIQLLQDQIDQLKDEIKTLKEQLKIKDDQIKAANNIANQAQTLNFADKKELKLHHPETIIEDKKKHWWQR